MSKLLDSQLFQHFGSLKRQYASDRNSFEKDWEQARAAYHMDDTLDKIYNGRAKIQVPAIDWKVNGIVARLNRVLFNVFPVGRYEAIKTKDSIDKNIIDLWNNYVFGYQLGNIEFTKHWKMFNRDKVILGTSVGKVTQEFVVEEFSYFDDEGEETVTKDDTYFRPILLETFYSDISKDDINESEACIHSTTVRLEDLIASDIYKNTELLVPTGQNVTVEQLEYLQFMGVTKTGQKLFEKNLQKTRKTGFVQIDECYGRYDLDGDGVAEEVLVVIANESVVIRAEKTPFRHKRYKRPFIVGRYIPIAGQLYGESKVIKGLNLLQELNASRAQATDAKTRSIAPMWWRDTSRGQIIWDGKWTPNGIISGQGSPAVQPILNPYLGSISINDALVIERDLDKLWSLSPAQQGTATRSQLPETARGTAALIEQNEMPINDIIENSAEELKIFFEMLYERNLRFKTIEDLQEVIPDNLLRAAGITDTTQMRELQLEIGAKILGNMEISNDVAVQQGWTNFLQWASSVPPLVRRLDWKAVAEKRLKSFGIRDDADDIWLPEEIVQEIAQQQEQAQAQAQQDEFLKASAQYEQKKAIDVDAKITEMGAEAQIEAMTQQKVD